MDFRFKGMKENACDASFDEMDFQKCPFLQNINKPTCFSFSSVRLPLPVLSGARGPIFEDGPSFDMAFKVFHGKDGVVPLGKSQVSKEDSDYKPAPHFNPLAAKCASISLSSFGLGGPFNFGPFSDKGKNQKKSKSSNDQSSSQKGSSSKHEALGDEWLKLGNCPIAKSYRAVSSVIPLVASALQPPPGMKFKCPPAIVAARAALSRTGLVKSLRPQPLPAKMLAIAALGMAVNVPLGVWREHTEKFSPSWFVAIHAAVPFIAMLRKSVLMPKAAMALTIAASILGQVIGSRAERLRLKSAPEMGGSAVTVAVSSTIPIERGKGSSKIVAGNAMIGCGAEGMMLEPLPLKASGPGTPASVCF